jgi:hypothetical protein
MLEPAREIAKLMHPFAALATQEPELSPVPHVTTHNTGSAAENRQVRGRRDPDRWHARSRGQGIKNLCSAS